MSTTPNEAGPRKALGRGLAALIPNAKPLQPSGTGTPAAGAGSTAAGDGFRLVPIERIEPNRAQPRKTFDEAGLDELAASIEEQGVLQPILVRRRAKGEKYEIVAGERRWRATMRAGLKEIPVVIKELTDSVALQMALVENIQRRDLDALEEAAAYAHLTSTYKLTQEQVAQAVGKSRVAVTNSMRLLKLPERVTQLLAEGQISAGHARAIMTLDSEQDMVRVAEDAAKRKVPVREVERRTRLMKESARKAAKGAVQGQTPAEKSVEQRLQRALSTKARLHNRQGKGRIEIFFDSFAQLDTILEKIES